MCLRKRCLPVFFFLVLTIVAVSNAQHWHGDVPGRAGFSIQFGHDPYPAHSGHMRYPTHSGHMYGHRRSGISFGIPLSDDVGILLTPDWSRPPRHTSHVLPPRHTSDVLPPRTAPTVPTAEQLAALSDEQLHGLLSLGLQALKRDLGDIRTGGTWKAYFQLEDFNTALTEAKDRPPAAPTLARLREILGSFDAVAVEPKYQVISRLWSFRTLRVTLHEYSLPPIERQQHMLVARLQALKRDLNALTDVGPGWKEYLQLLPLESILDSRGELSSSQREQLEEIVNRFDQVSREPKYVVVARLPAFEPTHRSLQRYESVIQANESPIGEH